MFDLIVPRGPVADRTGRTLDGAQRLAQALADRYGLTPRYAGRPAPVVAGRWPDTLARAGDTLAGLAAAVAGSTARGSVPLVVANTCSTGLATLPAAARAMPDLTVLYADAHGDFNTPATSGSGHLGGMALAGACGLWDSGYGGDVRPDRVVLAGARDLDDAERALIARTGVRVLASADVTVDGLRAAAGDAPVWIHVDWDVLEPGVLGPDGIPGGLPAAQVRDLFAAFRPGRLRGVSVAEFHLPSGADDAARATGVLLGLLAPLFTSPRPAAGPPRPSARPVPPRT